MKLFFSFGLGALFETYFLRLVCEVHTSGNRVRLLHQAAEPGALSLPRRFSMWVHLQWTWVCICTAACGQKWLTWPIQLISNNRSQNTKNTLFAGDFKSGIVFIYFAVDILN